MAGVAQAAPAFVRAMRGPYSAPERREWGVVDRMAYRDAMSRLGAAVNVVTTDGPAGRTGFTASAVCSVTDDPPTLLVCMNRGSEHNADFQGNRVLCVNTLTGAQQELSPVFGGQTDVDLDGRFAGASWSTLTTGSPVLQDAAASFDCRIVQVTEVGTHSVFFCEVDAIAAAPGYEGLIYFGRAYHRISIAA